MTSARALRVLHCPTAVGGHPPTLARAERELGLDSTSIVLDPPPFGYRADEVLVRPGGGAAGRELARWRLLLRALREFDVVHFNFGSSILPRYHPPGRGEERPLARRVYARYARLVELRDLAVLARAGKGIVVTYQGDDARQTDVVARRRREPFRDEVAESAHSRELDGRRRAAVATFDRHADAIFALNPDLLHVLPARTEFLPYASVDLDAWRPVGGRGHDGPPVLVHAPSDRRVKGTRFVLEAVDRLGAGGVEVDLQLVEGATNAEARAAYERADLAVDQLVSGWYGTLAVELMALGKPVVTYLHEEDLGRIPPEMRSELPLIRATPETLADVLGEWLTRRRHELPDVGRRSRAFVERWHDPRRVAARTKEVYERIAGRPSREAGGRE